MQTVNIHVEPLSGRMKQVILLLSALAAFSITGCSPEQAKTATTRAKVPVPVAIAVAIQKDVPIQLQAIGVVRPFASVSVKPRVDGQLGQIGFKQGDEVKKGDLIFQIEPRAFEVALNQAKAVL